MPKRMDVAKKQRVGGPGKPRLERKRDRLQRVWRDAARERSGQTTPQAS